ncbi:MAG: ABC transporter ATP-binding protein [Porphyromonadaceae bacterium]|nr:ABC transporter ATP-binding protein [Porphyromonadaceae bacterium]
MHLVTSAPEIGAYAGELIMLMGPNGSGKSTLMQTIAGLIAPISGKVEILGQDVAVLKHRERARLMSLVLTERIEHSNLTVWDIVTTGRYPYLGQRGKLRGEDVDVLNHCLACCCVERMQHRYFTELSDGEKQRVMIARALAQETPLMLLDEPTAHLDLPSRLEILTMLRGLARDLKKCILVSTHELDLALKWADIIWLLDSQRGLEAAAPEDLVLSGSIEHVFGGEPLNFDTFSGTFSLSTNHHQSLLVSAQGLRGVWLQRAIYRMGYIVVEKSVEKQEIAIENKEEADMPFVTSEGDGWKLCINNKSIIVPTLYALQQALEEYYPLKA